MKTAMQELVDIMNKDQISFTEWFLDNYKMFIEKEKEQIIKSFIRGDQNRNKHYTTLNSEEYYNQTYKCE